METKSNPQYYLPAPSHWPIVSSIGLFLFLVGIANWLHGEWFGSYLIFIGFLILIYILHGWFGTVIHENREKLLTSPQVDRSFRLGMCWFIFSEVMFFGAFFAALFYIRVWVLPTLSDPLSLTHILLWPGFEATWPLLQNPDPRTFIGPNEAMSAWGVATINTAILLSSGVTITIAHLSLLKNNRKLMLFMQAVTILLGITFLILQIYEYADAYTIKNLTLASGIYGTTFFMLTGFHGLHVTIGATALTVIFYRMLKNDFNPHNHFAFEAVAWYWHFVDVVWLMLFVFVYWI